MNAPRILQIIFVVILIASVIFKMGFIFNLIGAVGLLAATLWWNKTRK